jgi:putative transcriptional regulator
MTITHHPPDDTVLRYANGTLHEAPAIVVATHLSFCPACRHRMETYEMLGGSMLENVAPASLSPDALSATLAKLDALDARDASNGGDSGSSGSGSGAVNGELQRPDLPDGMEWPRPLRHYALPRWRVALPGVKWTAPSFAGADAGQLLIVHGMPGAKLPSHGHDGTEYTCVLTGSFSDSHGTYRAGDLIEASEDHDHQPIVGDEAECVCVIAIDGHLRLHGIARLLQPFLRL